MLLYRWFLMSTMILQYYERDLLGSLHSCGSNFEIRLMHAVVVLYNYYHRKNFHYLEFLDFISFCKLAVIEKPVLLQFMKVMQIEKPDVVDAELSITEQMILDACNICIGLDPLKDFPNTEGWSVSKVVVFVVDSKNENCLLQFSSVTQGVWSLIEKNLDVPCRVSGSESLQLLAFSAVKEKTGIEHTSLTVLESHTVYSLSMAKSMSLFYTVQYSEAFSEELTQVPIKDVINSLTGPMFTKARDGFFPTSVVDYFHLLPYMHVISDWLLRQNYQGSSQHFLEQPKSSEEFTYPMTDSLIKEGGSDVPTIESCSTVYDPQENDMMIDVPSLEPLMELASAKEGITSIEQKISDTSIKKFNVAHRSPNTTEAKVSAPKSCNSGIVSPKLSGKDVRDNRLVICDKVVFSKQPLIHAQPIPTNHNEVHSCQNFSDRPSSQNVDNVETLRALKENDLFHTALSALQKKRDDLYQQLRCLEDQIAQCERNLQSILDGGEDEVKLRLESIIEVCKGSSQCQTTTPDRSQQDSLQRFKRKRLSEAVLTLRNPCQELDDICSRNYWILPRYNVVPSNGGFIANVALQGVDFECSSAGQTSSSPRLARESAAGLILSKVRNMASQA
ncbi:hypothetical protein H6P81_013200 [Aristolochia fimbriata]|uniref:DRBM domain-containing protein n=1 Tax=Aristolochia fimbriata TaxID=158543 RepID=A0AAV7EHM3_ARIFI|nr:hypothetical protein H6P81_013200 [Aristolochia fimbriata]